MPKILITLLDRNNKYLELLATVLDTTKSQIMNDVLERINVDDLEGDFWEGWEDLYSEYQKFVDSVGSSEDEEKDDIVMSSDVVKALDKSRKLLEEIESEDEKED